MNTDDLQSQIDRSAQITAATMLLSLVVGKSDRRRVILDLYRRRIKTVRSIFANRETTFLRRSLKPSKLKLER